MSHSPPPYYCFAFNARIYRKHKLFSYSEDMNPSRSTHGYYKISISFRTGHNLLRTNNDRAFVIAQLQDLLSPRLIINEVPAYRQLASCIDLLAFSIRLSAINLVVFSIDSTICTDFTHRIIARLAQHQYEYHPRHYPNLPELQINKKLLAGPHQALGVTIALHQLHEDWEFDRYSSIGFYLHDRRGDWMKLWRITQLYDNDQLVYRELISQPGNRPKPQAATIRSPLPAS